MGEGASSLLGINLGSHGGGVGRREGNWRKCCNDILIKILLIIEP